MATSNGLNDAWGRPYIPAVGPRLKFLLALIFAAFAVLGASGAYLSSIRWLDTLSGRTYTTPFKYWMLIFHIGIGLISLLPFLIFGILHWRSAWSRPNRYAVKLGILLFLTGILICATGLGLIRLEGMPQLRSDTTAHSVVLWMHLLLPLLAVAFYVMHRRAGPDIKWSWGIAWGVGVGLFCAVMLYLHGQDPRQWYKTGSVEGEVYFQPSFAKTQDGNFIPPEAMMMDEYCMKCHADIYKDHLHSSHKFSSFSNPAYLFSVQETRQMGRERDGNVKGSRWCAGCHDPVPFFGGVFEDPREDKARYNLEKDAVRVERYQEVEDVLAGRKHPADSKISSAGITCVVCHAITNIDSTRGNAAFTIEEPQHYPFAYSKNDILQWINNQLIKSEPSFHKKTFLKPFHKTAEFCSTCHKVSLPVELNHYKEFLRGQNHYDSYLLSGASGVGVRSFYYPPTGKKNCNECHMPPKASNDFGARDIDGAGGLQVHNHRFVGANTGLFDLLARDPRYGQMKAGLEETVKIQSDFLRGTDPEGKDKKVRIDLFGIKDGAVIDGKLTMLRPELPKLKAGQSYLVEVVVRTVNLGHPFSQGTVDSNEIWVDFEARSGDRVFARNGATANPDDSGPVDPWAHFINVLMLDRNGNRINRRNPQDIFTPLYDKQIPPGAAAVAHYQLDIPSDIKSPVELKARVRYRKFDYEYMKLVHKDKPVPKLPIVDMCADSVTLPVEGDSTTVPAQTSPIKPAWQRWNDYGIGCYIEGGAAPTGLSQKHGEMKQALEAFDHLINTGDEDAEGHGYLNSARVLIDTGRLNEATERLNKASKTKAPWWTVKWFQALVAARNANSKEQIDSAIGLIETILAPENQPSERGFDFRRDYVVLGMLGSLLFNRSQLEIDNPKSEERFLLRAIDAYSKALALDEEDVDANYMISRCYGQLLGQNAPNLPRTNAPKSVTANDLESTGDELKRPELRSNAAIDLALALPDFLSDETTPLTDFKRPPKLTPKLPVVRSLIGKARAAFLETTDIETRKVLAQVLALLHTKANQIYKQDDQARASAVSTYRRAHSAANYAAEAIVRYPTTPAQIAERSKEATHGNGQ
jgi:tetratricopeptide (TPR) repeat protein